MPYTHQLDSNIRIEIKKKAGAGSIEYFMLCLKYSIPFDERVRTRAYYLWLDTGCCDSKKNYYEAEKLERRIDESLGVCSKHNVKLNYLKSYVMSKARIYLPCKMC